MFRTHAEMIEERFTGVNAQYERDVERHDARLLKQERKAAAKRTATVTETRGLVLGH
jgi:hypothetical protein